jgi:hypothetical protein
MLKRRTLRSRTCALGRRLEQDGPWGIEAAMSKSVPSCLADGPSTPQFAYPPPSDGLSAVNRELLVMFLASMRM